MKGRIVILALALVVLIGGGSLLYGLDKLIKEKTGINTIVAEDAVTCVAIGTGRYIEYVSMGKINPRDVANLG